MDFIYFKFLHSKQNSGKSAFVYLVKKIQGLGSSGTFSQSTINVLKQQFSSLNNPQVFETTAFFYYISCKISCGETPPELKKPIHCIGETFFHTVITSLWLLFFNIRFKWDGHKEETICGCRHYLTGVWKWGKVWFCKFEKIKKVSIISFLNLNWNFITILDHFSDISMI